jgi:5'-3' exonuclease
VDVSYQEEFFQILQANLQLIEKVCNGLPKTYVLRLHNLECDFIPYYLLTRAQFGKNPDQLNMLYSNDKDMWQTINGNTFIFSKTGKTKKLLTPGKLVSKFLKRECKIDDSYFPLVKAIWGDTGDDIDGVQGVGPAGIIEIFPEIEKMVGPIDDVYDNIQNRLPIFNMIPSKIKNKKMKSVVDAEINDGLLTKNLKLISFELLSRAIDDPIESKMNERKDHIRKLLNEKEIIKLDVMSDTLKRFNVTLDEDALSTIYHL